MNDYGRGGVLGIAIALPATSAGLFLLDSTHPLIILGFIVASFLSSVMLTAYIIRYYLSRKEG